MKRYFIILIIIFLAPVVVMAENGKLVIENNIGLKDNQNITYIITIANFSGAKTVKINDVSDYVIFDSRGTATIDVQDETVLEISDIPLSSAYSLTIKEIDNYNLYINNLETTEKNGEISDRTSLKITGKYFGREEKEPIEEETTKEVKANPKTSDSIALIGLIALFAMLIAYTLLKKKTNKYTY